MPNPLSDIRFITRSLARNPGFTATAVLTLALGIGASTAIFSVVEGVLLSPLPHHESERMLTIWGERTEQDFDKVPITPATFRDIEEQVTRLETVSGGWFDSGTLTGGQEPQRVRQAWVTPNHFAVLHIEPALGRTFTDDDESVAILSYGLWQTRFGSDPQILGQTIQLDGNALQVIGVLPPSPDPNTLNVDGTSSDTDLWRPMLPSWLQGDDRSNGWLRTTARLAPGATLGEAQAELDAIAARIREAHPVTAEFGLSLRASRMLDEIVGPVRPTLLVLLGAVIFVLLIACANVANLMLVRAQGREHELTIRSALGGGSSHLARLIMGESLLLSLTGGALGVLLALGSLELLVALDPPNVPRLDAIGLDIGVLGFALAAAVVSAVLAGAWPALKAARLDAVESLRARQGSSAASPAKARAGGGLVMVQVALSLILLAGAGLLLKSFAALNEVRPGYDTSGILTLSVAPSGSFEDGTAVAGFFTNLEERVRNLPGVVEAGSTFRLPLAGGLFTGPYTNDDLMARGAPEPEADYRPVTPGYHDAMGTTLIAGRGLTASDGRDVVVIDQQLARKHWPDGNAVGSRIRTAPFGGDPQWHTIVGVVEHMRHDGLAGDGREAIFWNLESWAWRGMPMYLSVRSSVEPATLVPAIRGIVGELDPNAPIARIRTIESLVSDATAPVRFAMVLIAVFAGVAVALAAIGLYGVLAYLVSRRRPEMGIRLALGATVGSVFLMVVRQGMVMTFGGLAVGTVAAAAATRVLDSLLFEVNSTDVSTYAIVAAGLVAVAALASSVPAIRATRVAPVEALREE